MLCQYNYLHLNVTARITNNIIKYINMIYTEIRKTKYKTGITQI